MPTAYAYIRYSRAIQQTGDSENRQFTALEVFENTIGLPIAEIIYDRGKSAFRGDNARSGRLKELLDRIEYGAIGRGDYLVVESIDRITRQRLVDGVELLQGILKKGVNIYTTTDQKTYSYNDPSRDFENLLMISVIAKRANEESELKSKRLNASWRTRREKAKAGEIIIKKGNSIPFGLRVINGEFVIHDEEQKEVQRLFELLLIYGLNTVIKKINENSIKIWNNGTVNKIIKSRSVVGCLSTHRVDYISGKPRKIHTGYIDNYYPKIISSALFHQALAKMKERKSKSYNGVRSSQDFNIFQHQIYCAKCQGKLYYDHRGSRYKDKIYPHYKCNSTINNSTSCDAENIRFEVVFALLLDAVKSFESVNKFIKSSTHNRFFGDLNRLSIASKAHKISNDAQHDELSTFKIQLENLKNSLEENLKEPNFKIPLSIIQTMEKLEGKISSLESEIEKCSTGQQEIDIDVSSPEKIISLFKTNEGRAQINLFFKQYDFRFYMDYDKASRIGTIQLYRNEDGDSKRIFLHAETYPSKLPLSKYGLGELQDIFNLKV